MYNKFTLITLKREVNGRMRRSMHEIGIRACCGVLVTATRYLRVRVSGVSLRTRIRADLGAASKDIIRGLAASRAELRPIPGAGAVTTVNSYARVLAAGRHSRLGSREVNAADGTLGSGSAEVLGVTLRDQEAIPMHRQHGSMAL